jgi:hypothetical protein
MANDTPQENANAQSDLDMMNLLFGRFVRAGYDIAPTAAFEGSLSFFLVGAIAGRR